MPRTSRVAARAVWPLQRDAVAFWICGLLNNVVFVVYNSAAEDLIKDRAGLILLLAVFPGTVTKAVLPLFAESLSYRLRVAVTSLTVCLCCLCVAVVQTTWWRLAFIGVSSCVGSLGEVTFLALTSEYDASTVGSWSSGTGFAGVVGAGIYHFLRAFMGLTARQSLLLVCPLSLLMFVTYATLLTSRKKGYALTPQGAGETDRLAFADTEDATPDARYPEAVLPQVPRGRSPRLYAVPWLFRYYMAPLMTVYCAEYVINQGISPTIDRFAWGGDRYRQPSTKEQNDLYTLYQLSYQVGVFVSRSSISFVKVPQIWIFPPLQLFNVAVLLIGSLFLYIPSKWVVVGIMLFEGLVGGGIYVNAFYKLRKTMPVRLRSWALGTTSVGDAFGVSVAALINIWLECAIRRHRGETGCGETKQVMIDPPGNGAFLEH